MVRKYEEPMTFEDVKLYWEQFVVENSNPESHDEYQFAQFLLERADYS